MASWFGARRWINALATTTRGSVKGDRGVALTYQPLYEYLRDRYANRVVLSFAEIEDLLGFPLPKAARLAQDWWDGEDSIARPSWTLANRSATVNLIAQVVVYERQDEIAAQV